MASPAAGTFDPAVGDTQGDCCIFAGEVEDLLGTHARLGQIIMGDTNDAGVCPWWLDDTMNA